MARVTVIVFVCLTLLLTYTTALPLDLWSVLTGRQLSTPPPPSFSNNHLPQNITDYDAKNWVLSTTTFIPNHYQTQPYVANGYHGSRVPAEGIGFWVCSPVYVSCAICMWNTDSSSQITRNESNPNGIYPINGWPLDNPRQTVATISGFWDSQHNTTRTNFPELLDKGGESVISGIPTWSTIYVSTPDGKYTYAPGVDPKTVVSFRQGLSIRNGVLTTEVTWKPPGGVSYDLKFTLLAHRSRINVGMVQVEITSSADSKVLVTDILDGAGAQRTVFGDKSFEDEDDMIWTSVKPVGISNVTAYEFSTLDFGHAHKSVVNSRASANHRSYVSQNASTISQEYSVNTKARRTVTINKFVGIASTDAFPTDTMTTARSAALDAKECGWKKVLEEHEAAWDELWEDADIIVRGDDEMQIATRATLFHLLSNIRGGSEGTGIGDNSVSVGGLSSDSYAGLVFWDADCRSSACTP